MAKGAMKGSMKSGAEKPMMPWMHEEMEKQVPMKPKNMPMKMKKDK